MALSFITSGVVLAEASKTKSKKTKESKKADKTTSKDNIDEEITNARMRASSGSKNKLSMSMGIGYSGGKLSDPFGRERPDIYGNPENETLTSIGGSVSGRYRFTKNDSVTLGAGLSYLAPLRSYDHPTKSQFNIDNPRFAYSRIGKIGIFQSSTGADLTIGTSESWEGAKLDAVLGFSHNMLTTIGKSGFTVGMSFAFNKYKYSDDPVAKGDKRTNFSIGLYPYAEYGINDKYSLRTVLGFMNYEVWREDKSKSIFSMHTSPSYQSIGVGIAFSRDIYIYPNIQFLPKDFEADKTNVAISATINI